MAPYVLIIGAVAGELRGLFQHTEQRVAEEIGRRPATRGMLRGVPVRLLTTGVGMANTVQSLTAVLEREPPGLILQTGCAGAFRESGLGVGDVGVASEEIDAHLGIEPEDAGDPPLPLPFPVMAEAGAARRGRYPLPRRWAMAALDALQEALESGGTAADEDPRAPKPRVASGPFLTVATVTATDAGAARRYRHYGACMEAMEGAGAAHAAAHYGVPLLEVRAASNLVGRRRRETWDLDLSFRRAAWAVLTILEHCRAMTAEEMTP